MRHLRLPVVLMLLSLLTMACGSLAAQETVIQVENVRLDYAQVLQVEPVFQTLTATQIEQQCESKPAAASAPPGGLSRIVGKVKRALATSTADAADHANCRAVPVQRQFRRPIAFDVDYIYKGMKYRSRLPTDPGNRLRVRVSVTPYVAPAAH
ncbi:MAG: hypothetical protein JWL98_49 [Xanthomonadaceae bacterium]|nr:hypothetical protein [Xanthomonadaceae bacterium]